MTDVLDAAAAPMGAAYPGVRPVRRARPANRVSGVPVESDGWPMRAFLTFADVLARYHRHRVVNFTRLRRVLRSGRRLVLVGNHALDIVDPLLLLASVYRELRLVPHFIGHPKGWFHVPVLRDIAARFQVLPAGNPEETLEAFRRAGFLMLYPGAVREAGMRRYRDEPYRLKWDGRTGFLRLALEADADVIFVAALGADEAYYQSAMPMPETILRLVNGGDGARYRGMPLRFGLLGLHLVPGVLPLPVRLTHVVSKPLDLGDRERARRDPEAFAALHARVWEDCQRFLDGVVARRGRYSDPLDRSIRGVQHFLGDVGL